MLPLRCLEDCDASCTRACSDGARFAFGDVHLAVLSACRTAASGGDGARPESSLAHLAATLGAHAVIGTLWSVGDPSTAAFMRAFYRDLRARGGVGKALSLQAAARELISRPEDPAWSHPWHWAAFTLIGNVR